MSRRITSTPPASRGSDSSSRSATRAGSSPPGVRAATSTTSHRGCSAKTASRSSRSTSMYPKRDRWRRSRSHTKIGPARSSPTPRSGGSSSSKESAGASSTGSWFPPPGPARVWRCAPSSGRGRPVPGRSRTSTDSSRSVFDSENRVDGLITPVPVDMMILDIMGKRTFLQLFKEAYFHGAKGVLAVFDVTRAQSLRDLTKWIDGVRDSVGPVPVYALGNKTDLAHRREVTTEEASSTLLSYECPVLYTSAKTGENVEQAFQGLAKTIVESSSSQ